MDKCPKKEAEGTEVLLENILGYAAIKGLLLVLQDHPESRVAFRVPLPTLGLAFSVLCGELSPELGFNIQGKNS